MRNKVNNSGEEKIVAFWGERAEFYSRFASAMLSYRRDILVVDLAENHSLFIGAVGDTKERTVKIHTITYTKDLEYMLKNIGHYESVVLHDDFSNREKAFDHYQNYDSLLRIIYMCFGASKYSLIKFKCMSEMIGKNKWCPYAYVFEGSEREARIWRVSDYWKHIEYRCPAPQTVYMIPRDDADYEEYLKLGYGTFRMRALSRDFRHFLTDILNMSLMDESKKSIIEENTLFCV